jgi:hypothetical protein
MFAKLRIHLIAVFLLVTTLLCGTLPATAQVLPQGPVPSRITAPVDNAVRVTVARSTHPMAQAQFDRGPVDPRAPMDRMILVLSASLEQEHQARALLDSQQTKGSPDYHHWLTPEEFGQKFGVSQQDIQQVTAWLQQQGFRVGSVAKGGRWIEFSGTADQVQAAFHTQMRNYQVKGEMHLANASDISIPTALSPVVLGVSLHNFFSKAAHRQLGTARRTASGSYMVTKPDGTFGTQHALSPGDFANIYNLNPLYTANINGSGQTIGIVARSDVDPVDISDFKTLFNVNFAILNVILNGPDPGLVPGDQDEATLDVEWSSAVSRGIIDLVVSSSTATTDGVDLSAAYIVDNNFAQVMSTSFSECELFLGTAGNAFYNNLWEQAAAQGISAFVSAGDDGAAACDDPNSTVATGGVAVSGLASTPFNTAVGGTEFDEALGGGDATFWNTANLGGFVSAKGYIPEMAWNESCSVAACGAANANLFAGSGGVSTIYGTPSWQKSTGIPGLNFATRALPDLSLAAAGHDGFLVCVEESCEPPSNQFLVFGGTSASSPAFAGIMAIIDQKIGAGLTSRQGLANYVLYSLAKNPALSCNSAARINPATPNPTCVFNDTTTGNNSVPGQTGFNAVAGYDLATGLGSVDANNLVNAFATAVGLFQATTTTLAANPAQNPITITHGASLNFNAGVTRAGSTGTPSGTISLTASGGTLTGSVGVGATTISGSGATANGTFTGVSDLPGGTAYNLIAHYPGDNSFSASDSSALTVTVNPEGSTTTLTSIIGFTSQGVPILGTTIQYGGFLDLRTVVSSSANTSPPDAFPSGTITIVDNFANDGTLTLNAQGQAELINCSTPAPTAVPCLAVGLHNIQIKYGGDNGFSSSSTASATNITVTKATSTGTLSTPSTATFNTPITVSAQVNAFGPVMPNGTVQFFQGANSLGAPVTLTPGNPSTASAQVTLTGTGSQSVTVQYSGDSTYNSATFGPNTVTVSAPFNFTSSATSQTISAGATATYNVTLNAVGGFTGQVSFNCTGAPGGSTCSVSPNPATLGTSVPLTVTVTNTANARLAPTSFKTLPFVFAMAFAGLLWGVRRKPRQVLFLVLGLALIVGVGSCGGGGTPPVIVKQPTIATLTVTGTNGGATNTITLTLTITH